MPLELYFYPSFEHSLKSLDTQQQETVKLLLKALLVYYASGCNLLNAQTIAPRFLYKQLRRPYYEVAIENKIRVVIEREGSNCNVVLAGNHDDVKKFLANH